MQERKLEAVGQTKSVLHINCLELLAVFHAVQAFANNKKDTVIQVYPDNTTAVA